MGRKFRSTEISGEVIVGQRNWTKANWFCINCHHIGHLDNHYPGCQKHESYAVSPSAEAPLKNAPKRKWDIFKKQFVFAKPVGMWDYKGDSWWAKTHGPTQEQTITEFELERFRRNKLKEKQSKNKAKRFTTVELKITNNSNVTLPFRLFGNGLYFKNDDQITIIRLNSTRDGYEMLLRNIQTEPLHVVNWKCTVGKVFGIIHDGLFQQSVVFRKEYRKEDGAMLIARSYELEGQIRKYSAIGVSFRVQIKN